MAAGAGREWQGNKRLRNVVSQMVEATEATRGFLCQPDGPKSHDGLFESPGSADLRFPVDQVRAHEHHADFRLRRRLQLRHHPVWAALGMDEGERRESSGRHSIYEC